jgi:hypothetical protein
VYPLAVRWLVPWEIPARPSFSRTSAPDLRKEYPLPGQGEVQFFVRGYAPFRRFGGGYAGDERSASVDTRATARLWYVLTVNVAGMTRISTNTWSDESHGHGWFPRALFATAPLSAGIDHNGTVVGRGIPTQRTGFTAIGRPGHGFAVAVDLAGPNPLVGMAADIDIQLNMRVEKDRNGLAVAGNLRGDGFPNAEVFLRDAAGDAVFVHTYETPGGADTGPYEYLPGHNFRMMGSFHKRIAITEIGLIDDAMTRGR